MWRKNWEKKTYKDRVDEIKKALIKYKAYKKDKELAAMSFGISRATLYRKLEKYKDKINGDTYLK